MGNEITLVTAFFDCQRGNNQLQSRTITEYMSYFKFWARIKNRLIIYTTPEFKKEILSIRCEFGLGSQTELIVIENIWEIEKKLYHKMCEVERRSKFADWRYSPDDISNQAKYDYIMLMKYWCLNDSVRRQLTADLVCWIDFGWNHGGQVYYKPEEFSFEWKYNFSSKIHLFTRSDPEKDTGIIRLQSMTDSIMGASVICSACLCEKLYQYCIDAMWSLLSLDCFDDDQMLLRMAYKKHKEDFEIHLSDWFLPMKEYGGFHLSVKTDIVSKQITLYKIYNKLFKLIKGMTIKDYKFVKRLLHVVKREG